MQVDDSGAAGNVAAPVAPAPDAVNADATANIAKVNSPFPRRCSWPSSAVVCLIQVFTLVSSC